MSKRRQHKTELCPQVAVFLLGDGNDLMLQHHAVQQCLRKGPNPPKCQVLDALVCHVFRACPVQIGRLKKLVGRKGFSNNPAAEINEVMKLFEGDMAGLQRDISSLQR